MIWRKKIPDNPGVYLFLGKNREILYVGKATSLKNRVKSYFNSSLLLTRGPLVTKMIKVAKSVEFRKTDSVLEALILEADLIKKFQPEFNTRDKDDKSFSCVVITDEDFPRVLIVRKKDVDFSSLKTINYKLQTIFGPFPHGGQLKEALKIIRKIFPFRDKCEPNQSRPCFNRQIGLCPGVCTGEISKIEYGCIVNNIKLFFEGKKSAVLKNLKREMAAAARAQAFERAGAIKKTLFSLQHIQDVSLIKKDNLHLGMQRGFRVEAYDIAHLSGTVSVGAMVVVEDGQADKSQYRKFIIRGGYGNNDIASLKEVFERRLGHDEWFQPSLIVADGGLAQKAIIETALRNSNFSISVVAVTKDERHKALKILGDVSIIKAHKNEILLANSEAHRFALSFHRQQRRRMSLTQKAMKY